MMCFKYIIFSHRVHLRILLQGLQLILCTRRFDQNGCVFCCWFIYYNGTIHCVFGVMFISISMCNYIYIWNATQCKQRKTYTLFVYIYMQYAMCWCFCNVHMMKTIFIWIRTNFRYRIMTTSCSATFSSHDDFYWWNIQTNFFLFSSYMYVIGIVQHTENWAEKGKKRTVRERKTNR